MVKKITLVCVLLFLYGLTYSLDIVDLDMKASQDQDSQITLTWNHYTQEEVLGYDIMRHINKGQYIKINKELITTNSFVDTDVRNLEQHEYIIYCTLKSGKKLCDNRIIVGYAYGGDKTYYLKGDINTKMKFIKGSVYVIEEDITFNNRLWISGGAIIKVKDNVSIKSEYTSNMILPHGGTIVFTSYKDDRFGGDTNGDGDLTKPQKGDWDFLKLAMWNGNGCPYLRICYATTGYVFGNVGATDISYWIIEDCENALGFEGDRFKEADFSMNFKNSDFINCTNLIRGNYYPLKLNITNNWYGNIVGPYHATRNPQGKGCVIPNDIVFEPYSQISNIVPSVKKKLEFQLNEDGGTSRISVSDYFTINSDKYLYYKIVSSELNSISIKSGYYGISIIPKKDKNGINKIKLRLYVIEGTYIEKDFIINVLPVNDKPSNIILSNTTIKENTVVGSQVGVLSAVDVDVNQTFTYTIKDNAYFEVKGNKLVSKAVFNFEKNQSYATTLTVTDQDGLSYTKDFTISINNVNDKPVFTSTPVLEANSQDLYKYTIEFTDEDKDAVKVSIIEKPEWLEFSQKDKTYMLEGKPTETGEDPVIIELNDGQATVQQKFNINTVKITSITNVKNYNAIKIYPNPVKDILNISIDKIQDKDMTIELYNTIGKLVLKKHYHVVKVNNTIQQPISGLTKGIYILHIKTKSFNQTYKVVKL